MKSPVLATAALCLLASCAPTAQEMEAQRLAQERANYDNCVRYGAVPNTPAFNDCMRDQVVAYQQSYYGEPYYENYPYRSSFTTPAYPSSRSYYYYP